MSRSITLAAAERDLLTKPNKCSYRRVMYHWQPQHPAWPQHQDCYAGSSIVGHVTRYGSIWHASVGRDRLDNIEYPTIRAAQKAVEHAVTMKAWTAEREGPDPFP